MDEASRVVVWQSLTGPGADWCELSQIGDLRRLSGTVVTAADGVPVSIDYEVDADPGWNTRMVAIETTIGRADTERRWLAVDGEGHWHAGQFPPDLPPWVNVAGLTGLADIDLAFTPATNLLPIRRLHPAIGETVAVTAAWLRFPELVVEPLPQTYHRLDERRYRYEANGGEFSAEMVVDDLGLVAHYEGWFERVATSE